MITETYKELIIVNWEFHQYMEVSEDWKRMWIRIDIYKIKDWQLVLTPNPK